MSVARYLNPAWARRQVDLALPFLAPDASVAIVLDGKRLVEKGAQAAVLSAATPGRLVFPLLLEAKQIGALLVLPVADAVAAGQAWGSSLVHALQGVLDAEYARRAVGQETLQSYREMALLQRAVTDLNHSLNPAAVAAALLKEFDGRKDAAKYGAVFLRHPLSGSLELIQSFGDESAAVFSRFQCAGLFAEISARETGDILNDLTAALSCGGEVADFQSLMWLPLNTHAENLGLLVLASRQAEGFSASDLKRAQTLASVAATALHNAQLYAAEQVMFQSFVQVIATAIDAKSPYTAGHCRRVPEIALMLAEAAHRADGGAFADFTLTDDEHTAIEIAAMLHDCGKVVTPEWIIDKTTKLDAIVDRFELVALRFELLRRDALLERERASNAGNREALNAAEAACQTRLQQLDDDLAFLEKCNPGGEFTSAEHIARIQAIAALTWCDRQDNVRPVLDADEVYNLCTQRGTLNPKERKIIEDHAVHTISMLSQIAFPRRLRNVTEYAACHHERVDGKGYPRGLKRDQLSLPARIMAIADIFEALTAPDRPYRKPGTLNWAIGIMHRMKLDGHIDGELFDLFLSERIFATYAQKHLVAEQFDEVDVGSYLSRSPA